MLVNMTEEEWDAVIRVHLKGTFAPTRFAAAYWRERSKAGRAGRRAHHQHVVDVGHLRQPGPDELRRRQGGHRRRSRSSPPRSWAATASPSTRSRRPRCTRMTENLGGGLPAPADEEWSERSPDNIAPVVDWLASAESAGITGQVFLVAGGRIAIAKAGARGPGVDRGARWDPAELGAVITGTGRRDGAMMSRVKGCKHGRRAISRSKPATC